MKFTFSDEMQKVVRKVFVSLYREGLIYQGTYIVNHCPSCKTVLSDLEVEHKEINGKLTYIRYPLAGNGKKFIVVATTRPETMLGDTASPSIPKIGATTPGRQKRPPAADQTVSCRSSPMTMSRKNSVPASSK